MKNQRECGYCGIPLEVENFRTCGVYYCPLCAAHKREIVDCDHDNKLYYFILSNKGKQLKEVCVKCLKRSNALLQGNPPTVAPLMSEEYYQDRKSSFEKEVQLFLKELRFRQSEFTSSDYNTYMSSPEWRSISGEAKIRDRNTCQICGAEATDVHHLSYAHFKHEFLFELVSLCRKCHIEEYHSPKARVKIDDTLAQKAASEQLNTEL